MERLRAARALRDSAVSGDLSSIRHARSRETDSWTQKALDRVIARLNFAPDSPILNDARGNEAEDLRGVQAQALQVATQRVVHEVRPILQSIQTVARAELADNYQGSRTRDQVDRLASLLDALKLLGEAADAPRIAEFNLSEMISKCVHNNETFDPPIVLARTEPVVVAGDPRLLAIAFENIVRNAVEASANSRSIVVNWGVNDADAWVAVLDDGEGLPDDGFEAALQVGATSRADQGHFGLGLPTAIQAMESLGGQLTLRPRKSGGTAAELRWPQ